VSSIGLADPFPYYVLAAAVGSFFVIFSFTWAAFGILIEESVPDM
jgi:hypothetical protein